MGSEGPGEVQAQIERALKGVAEVLVDLLMADLPKAAVEEVLVGQVCF